MDTLTVILLAFGLAMDSFSVSICSGAGHRGRRLPIALRVGLVMGGFQALMPLLGWLGGAALSGVIARFDHWIAFALLAFIGGRMLYEAWRGEEDDAVDACSWRRLLVLGVATSIDALAVGVSFAFLGSGILGPVAVIGAVTFALCVAGVYIGCQARNVLRGRAPALGGVILLGIGTRILIEHLSAGAPI